MLYEVTKKAVSGPFSLVNYLPIEATTMPDSAVQPSDNTGLMLPCSGTSLVLYRMDVWDQT